VHLNIWLYYASKKINKNLKQAQNCKFHVATLQTAKTPLNRKEHRFRNTSFLFVSPATNDDLASPKKKRRPGLI